MHLPRFFWLLYCIAAWNPPACQLERALWRKDRIVNRIDEESFVQPIFFF
jgi:hypothetical protein